MMLLEKLDNLIQFNYLIAFSLIIAIAMIVMIFLARKSIVLTPIQKRRFIYVFILVIAIGVFNISSCVLEEFGPTHLISLDYFCNFCGFLVTPFVPIMMSRIIQEKSKNKFPEIFYGVYAFILCFLVGFEQIFYVDENFVYHRVAGGFYFFIAVYFIALLYLLISMILLTIKMLSKTPYILYLLFALMIAGCLMQMFMVSVNFMFLISGIIAIIYYNYVSSLWSQIDGMSGLFGQYAFISNLPNIKDGQAIFVMDIDNFKQVNDTYGHIEGDKILKEVARIIQSTFGHCARSYRIGGDEFVALCYKEMNSEELINKFKAKIKDEMDNDSHFPNVSIGFAKYEKGQDLKDFETLADKNMYMDKAINKARKVSE